MAKRKKKSSRAKRGKTAGQVAIERAEKKSQQRLARHGGEYRDAAVPVKRKRGRPRKNPVAEFMEKQKPASSLVLTKGTGGKSVVVQILKPGPTVDMAWTRKPEPREVTVEPSKKPSRPAKRPEPVSLSLALFPHGSHGRKCAISGGEANRVLIVSVVEVSPDLQCRYELGRIDVASEHMNRVLVAALSGMARGSMEINQALYDHALAGLEPGVATLTD